MSAETTAKPTHMDREHACTSFWTDGGPTSLLGAEIMESEVGSPGKTAFRAYRHREMTRLPAQDGYSCTSHIPKV